MRFIPQTAFWSSIGARAIAKSPFLRLAVILQTGACASVLPNGGVSARYLHCSPVSESLLSLFSKQRDAELL